MVTDLTDPQAAFAALGRASSGRPHSDYPRFFASFVTEPVRNGVAKGERRMKRWYVVQTRPRDEATALFHLDRQGFEGYLPRFLKQRRHARRVDHQAGTPVPRLSFRGAGSGGRPLAFHPGDRRASAGSSAMARTPAPVPARRCRERFRGRRGRQGGWIVLRPEKALQKGQKVEISQGPFADLMGTFEALDSKERVIVLLNLLGREVRARVPSGWIQAPA